MRKLLVLSVILFELVQTDVRLEKTNPAEDFVCRLLGKKVCENIKISVNRKMKSEEVHISTKYIHNQVFVSVEAGSIGSFIFGLRNYLEQNTSTTYTQFGISNTDVNLVDLRKVLHLRMTKFIRFYGNICAFSYSYWYWDWNDWEKHIDWIAFKGFNVVLVPMGIESVQLDVFTKLGLLEEQVLDFFNGPAYLAWSRMGNMKHFSGPLTEKFLSSQLILQRKICERLNDLGVRYVIPGFSGFVPDALVDMYDNKYFNNVSCWNRFNSSFTCLKQLDPSKALYNDIGQLYMKTLLSYFRTNSLYAIDMFNENTPVNGTDVYLSSCSNSTVSVIKSADSVGKWVLQGWTFGYEYDRFWTKQKIASYIASVNNDDILILDMFAEARPVWNTTNSFFGKPFIWTLINNFGGNTVINGNVKQTVAHLSRAIQDSKSFVGFGFMPEGIQENTILLDAVMGFVTSEEYYRNTTQYLGFWEEAVSSYRYGGDHYKELLKFTIRNLYVQQNYITNYRKSLMIFRRPGFNLKFHTNSNIGTNRDILNQYLINTNETRSVTEVVTYDFLSILQNYSELVFSQLYLNLMEAYAVQQLETFEMNARRMHEMLTQLDTILSLFPLKSLACYEQQVLKFASEISFNNPMKLVADLRRQISIWGYNEEIIDYAFKIWSGALSDYYSPRWNTFISHLKASLKADLPFDQEAFARDVSIVEHAFVNSDHVINCLGWSNGHFGLIKKLVSKFLSSF